MKYVVYPILLWDKEKSEARGLGPRLHAFRSLPKDGSPNLVNEIGTGFYDVQNDVPCHSDERTEVTTEYLVNANDYTGYKKIINALA